MDELINYMIITYDINILQKQWDTNKLMGHEMRMIRSEQIKEFFG
jgi:hypothetical protein